MFIPKDYIMADRAEALLFMKKYNFATIVTVKDNFQTGTHLPFVIEERNGKIMVLSHFAKANQQWHQIVLNKVLVIFSEPHAYISPSHYEKELNVPTWNYLSVHVCGQGKIITDTDKSFELLDKMINSYEPEYKKQWDQLPSEYKLKMLNGIVPFEIEVTDIQAKKKLSQNKTDKEKQTIISAFEKSNFNNEREIAVYMKKENTNSEGKN